MQGLVDQQSAGYIHGDIKINNVMVVRNHDGSEGHDWHTEYSGKLIDLGFSKPIGWCQRIQLKAYPQILYRGHS